MMNRAVKVVAALCVLAGVALSRALSSAPLSEQPPALDKKGLAAILQQKGAPAPEHAHLERLVGEFDTEFRMTFEQGKPPIIARGTMTGKWVLGKRFVMVTSSPAPDEELKMESISYFGYDKRSGKFFWWGIDSTDTYSVFAEGQYDQKTRTFTLLGENEEPGMGKIPFKTVLKTLDDKRGATEVWFQAKGAPGADADGWFRMVENIATRK